MSKFIKKLTHLMSFAHKQNAYDDYDCHIKSESINSETKGFCYSVIGDNEPKME